MDQTVSLKIHRFKKKYSLFQKGLRPYARVTYPYKGEWEPAGTQIAYLPQHCYNNQGDTKNREIHYLTFSYHFQKDIQVEFAACIPYTYTFMERRIEKFDLMANQTYKSEKKELNQLVMRKKVLCKTLCGLEVPLLTFSTVGEHKDNKKYIIIVGRMHPGETSSSWVIDGLINKICTSKKLHEAMYNSNLSFKIVPMMNSDGVVVGNYRTGILGEDYNRNFLSGNKKLFPQITALKQLVGLCKRTGKIELFLDVHGHSVRKSSFIYGPGEFEFSKSSFKELPYELERRSMYFDLKACRMRADAKKIETSRIYFQCRDALLTMTCENSLGLYTDSKTNKVAQHQEEDWRKFGADLANSLREIIETNKEAMDIKISNLFASYEPKYEPKNTQTSDVVEVLIRSKTCEEDIEESIRKISLMDKGGITQREDLSLGAIEETSESYESNNDSDSSDEDLTLQERKELHKIVMLGINKNEEKKNRFIRNSFCDEFREEELVQKHKFEMKQTQSEKKDFKSPIQINKFREYHFGNRRELSVDRQKSRKNQTMFPLSFEPQSATYSSQQHKNTTVSSFENCFDHKGQSSLQKTNEKLLISSKRNKLNRLQSFYVNLRKQVCQK